MSANRTRLLLPSAVAALSLLGACNANVYQPPPPVEVVVSKPVSGKMEDSLLLDGLVSGVQSVEIRAEVEGKITAIHFEDGQMVKEGDLLFTIDPRTLAAEASGASAQVAALRAQLAYAEADFNRQQQLYEAGNVSLQRFEQSRQALKALQAQVNAAKAGAAGAAVQLEYTRVVSPITGKMSRRYVDKGQLVGAGSPTPLATVVSTGATYVEFSIAQSDLLWARQYLEKQGVKTGADAAKNVVLRVALPGEEGFPHVGRMQSVENVLSASSGTLKARGIFDNDDGKLLPGLFCRVEIVLGTSEGLAIPELALMLDQVGRYVFVVNDKSEIERANVTLGGRKGDLRRITDGLDATHDVVVRGMARVRLGSKVKPTVEQVDAVKAAGEAAAADGAAPAAGNAPAEPAAPAAANAAGTREDGSDGLAPAAPAPASKKAPAAPTAGNGAGTQDDGSPAPAAAEQAAP